MKTKAVRIYGKKDLRLEEFELPELEEDEILMEIISDSVCMSTYKEALQGEDHQRVNEDIKEHPIIVGHECAGIIRKVGAKWKDKYRENDTYTIQPALNIEGSMGAIGYSFEYCGGTAAMIKIPSIVMEKNCLLPFDSGNGFFQASLAEPMSCIIGAFHSMYHSERGIYHHEMGIVEGGKSALLASCGPMGLGAIGYMLNCDRRPSLLVVTDIDEARLERAEQIFSAEYAKERGVEIHYVNTAKVENDVETLRALTGGTGFDDVSVYAPIPAVIETADKILGFDGCLNFFAGPVDPNLSATFNFFNVHYKMTHLVGSSGGNTDDMRECLKMAGEGTLDPSVMVTHVGGMNSAIDTILNLPKIPGGKKLVYVNIDMEMTAIDDFEEKGKTDERFACLHEITKVNNGLWCKEAEDYVLENFKGEDASC